MRQEMVFDVLGRDFFTSAIDHVFRSAFHHQMSGRQSSHYVSRSIKAVGRKCARALCSAAR